MSKYHYAVPDFIVRTLPAKLFDWSSREGLHSPFHKSIINRRAGGSLRRYSGGHMRKFLWFSRSLTKLGCGLLAGALFLALPAAARAQALGGSLVGTVTDETGAALP